MIEIWLAFTLCKSIKNNALERGRKPGGFIALAIILWVVLELTGFIIGAYFELGYGSFIIAYSLVGIGAAISYNVAKHCREGDYVTPQEQLIRQFTEYYEPLAVTQEILITREKAFAGSAAKYEMILNGKSIGFVANGDTLHGFTDQRQNVLVARVNGGNDIPPSFFRLLTVWVPMFILVPEDSFLNIQAESLLTVRRLSSILHWLFQDMYR